MSEEITVDSYVASLETGRRAIVSSIRDTVNAAIDPGFEEMIDFGMITWCVPLERYPDTYNGHPMMYAALASQKRYVSLYLMGIYADPAAAAWFQDEYANLGRKPDMGKSCVRFRKLEDVPGNLIEQAISRYSVDSYLKMVEQVKRA